MRNRRELTLRQAGGDQEALLLSRRGLNSVKARRSGGGGGVGDRHVCACAGHIVGQRIPNRLGKIARPLHAVQTQRQAGEAQIDRATNELNCRDVRRGLRLFQSGGEGRALTDRLGRKIILAQFPYHKPA
jgi:hypothetical protein